MERNSLPVAMAAHVAAIRRGVSLRASIAEGICVVVILKASPRAAVQQAVVTESIFAVSTTTATRQAGIPAVLGETQHAAVCLAARVAVVEGQIVLVVKDTNANRQADHRAVALGASPYSDTVVALAVHHAARVAVV